MYEPWRQLAEKMGRKYGVAVYVTGTSAYSTDTEVYLPADIPPDMQGLLVGLMLHEFKHITEKDHEWSKKQDQVLWDPLNVVQDMHNDNLILESDPGAEGLWREEREYVEKKNEGIRELIHWKQKVVLELLYRAWPRSIAEGFHFKDPKVKNFLKKNRREVKQMHKEMLDLRPNRDAQLKWARWLLEKLYGDVISAAGGIPGGSGPGAGAPGGVPGSSGNGIPDPIPPAIAAAIQAAIQKQGGLVPKKFCSEFECISPGDLKQKVPEAVTVTRLKEFLTEMMERETPEETGGINPAKLPVYFTEPDDLYTTEKETITKTVRVHLLLDASGSMKSPLPDGTKKYEAVCRATGLVAQAADKIIRDEGLQVEVEAWAFGTMDRKIKSSNERWDPYEFKKRYWSNDGGTTITDLVEQIEAIPDDAKVRDVVIVVTDGQFDCGGSVAIEKAQKGAKKWILIGIGIGAGDPLFRFSAQTLDEIEYILCQCVKEAMVQ